MTGAVLDTEPMTADEIRRGLREAQRRKERAEAAREAAVADQRRLLAAVSRTPGVTMTEAAQILKISRRMAHGMVNPG